MKLSEYLFLVILKYMVIMTLSAAIVLALTYAASQIMPKSEQLIPAAETLLEMSGRK